MYKLDLPVDTKESAAIGRRRQKELERQSRIFNAKVRTIGVDIEALEQQCAERNWIEAQEKERNEALAQNMIRNDKICVLLQKRQEDDLRKLNIKLNEFRKIYQTCSSRKEWDLYDPDAKLKDKPARVSDDDPRCGVSSLQKFLGEDLSAKDRKKLQHEQTREWYKQQKIEKMQEEANARQANYLYDLKAIENDQRAIELARAEEECKRAINVATKDLNKALSMERAAKSDLEKQQVQEDNLTEIKNNIFGDMLTENPNIAQSAFGSHRVVPDRWKGMSPAELNQIRNVQNNQIIEKKRLEEEERQHNEAWDKQRIAQAKAGTIMERQQEKLRHNLQKKQAEENLRLAAEQKAHADYLQKEVYTNQPTSAFFTQFNQSSR